MAGARGLRVAVRLAAVDISQTQRFSDYRRFEVETSSEVQPPRQ